MASDFDERVRIGLIRYYSLDELKDLCHDLRINYETLRHDTLNNLARDLIRYMRRRNRLPELIRRLRRERPFHNWPDPPLPPSAKPRSAKLASYLGGSHLPKMPGGQTRKPTNRASTTPRRRSGKSTPGYNLRPIYLVVAILIVIASAVGLNLLNNARPIMQAEQPQAEQPAAVPSVDTAASSIITQPEELGLGNVNDAVFSPDGSLVAVAASGGVTLLNAPSLTFFDKPPTTSEATSIAFSSEGDKLAAGLADGRVIVWSMAGGGQLHEQPLHSGPVSALAFLSNGESVLTGSEDGSVQLWPLSGGQPVALTEEIGSVYAVAVSGDGLTLAAAGSEGVIQLWNASTAIPAPSWTIRTGSTIRALAFAPDVPDGTKLATAGDDGIVTIWSVVGGSTPAPLNSGTAIHAFAYSPNGDSLALGQSDGNARLWLQIGGVESRTLGETSGPAHVGAVTAVSFPQIGNMLLTASRDDGVKTWSFPDGRLLGAAR